MGGAIGAVVIALVIGVVIGHAVWEPPPTSTTSNIGGLSPSAPSGGSGGAQVPSTPSTSSGPSYTTSATGPSLSTVKSIAAKVQQGLVDINTTLSYQSEEAAGTGMVLTSTGEILTNNHVIEDETALSVTDIGNGKTYSATIVGYDRTNDVAVLQLHNASGLKTVSLGNSSTVKKGEKVIGIGNAGGIGGAPSAAGGSVTALDQSITASDSGDGTTEKLKGLIETNAGIQPGDSGGPLVTPSGKVLGMDTAASAGFTLQPNGAASGIQAYSIPIDQALSIARQIESGAGSSIVHIGGTGFLGVEVESASAASSSGGLGGPGGFGGFGGSPQKPTSGALVVVVVPNTPAATAGIVAGDVITSFNGQSVTSASSLTNLIEPFHPGASVAVGWTNTSGQAQTATVQLVSGPPQ